MTGRNHKQTKSIQKTQTQKAEGAAGKNGRRGRTGASAGRNVRMTETVIRKKKSFFRSEASAVLCVLFCLLLFLSDLGTLGLIGGFLEKMQKGCFGTAAYLFPFLILSCMIVFRMYRSNAFIVSKIVSIVVFYLNLCCFLQLLCAGRELLSAGEYFALGASNAFCGGITGGCISGLLIRLIGRAGAWLVLVAVSLICVIIVSEKSIVHAAGTTAKKSAELAGKGKELYQAKRTERKEHTERLREQKRLRDAERSLSVFTLEENLSELEAVPTGQAAAGETEVLSRGETPSFRGETPSFRGELTGGGDAKAEAEAEAVTKTGLTVNPAPDYSVDTVPFEETDRDRYRSYAHILRQERVSAKELGEMGFAAEERRQLSDPVILRDFLREESSADGDPMPLGQLKLRSAEEELYYPKEETFTGAEEEICVSETGKRDLQEEKPSFSVPESDTPDTELFSTAGGRILNGVTSREKNEILSEKLVTDPVFSSGEESFVPEADTALSTKEGVKTSERTNFTVPASASRTSQTAVSGSKPAAGGAKARPRPYVFPPVSLLEKGRAQSAANQNELSKNALKLEEVLRTFNVGVRISKVTRGPSVTRYEMIPDIGVKVSQIKALEGDIKLALAAADIRIEAPIPGKSAVGIEVPNEQVTEVKFRDILESDEFRNSRSRLSAIIGRDIQGNPVIADLTRMPHVLVSGTTGSGKSVGINSIIMSILYHATPEEVRLIMVDPKVVELSNYNGIPHLLTPVVTTTDKALGALNWACGEMNERYQRFSETGTRNIGAYNEKIKKLNETLPEEQKIDRMPFILIIIDELAELMMNSKKNVESAIVSLTQLARAAGIHLVVATQRPSVDVVTGLIKANIPSRIAYKLPSLTDSRTILDTAGAEALLGNGDMLYKPNGENSPARVQGAFLRDDEIERVISFIKANSSPDQHALIDESRLCSVSGQQTPEQETGGRPANDRDALFVDSGRLITDKNKATIGMLQRKFSIGFTRAARIMDQLCEAGVVGDDEGTKPRRVLMTADEFELYIGKNS